MLGTLKIVSKRSTCLISVTNIVAESDRVIFNFRTEGASDSGKRISRGLYRSKNGILINADVNGSYNIMRKGINKLNKLNVVLKLNSDGIEDVGLHPIRVNVA